MSRFAAVAWMALVCAVVVAYLGMWFVIIHFALKLW